MLDLTREEKRVVLFLVVIALSGSGLNFLSKKFSPVRSMACVNPDLGKININTADKLTLKLIPGVGEKLAERILDYRKENQKFSELEELRKIKGFSNRTLEKAREIILIE
jgi:competence ComEA-like helix-hairpin-helix protein